MRQSAACKDENTEAEGSTASATGEDTENWEDLVQAAVL
jgi:hypothetical protein